MPIANGFIEKKHFSKEYFFDMQIGFSKKISLFQLNNHPIPDQMFNKNYPFFTGSSNEMINHFKKYADCVYYQPYKVNNKEYKNVVCVFGSQNKKTIVVGAHYDVCGDQDGADDNASGVVGLLELAKLLNGKQLKYRIEIVVSGQGFQLFLSKIDI